MDVTGYLYESTYNLLQFGMIFVLNENGGEYWTKFVAEISVECKTIYRFYVDISGNS